MAARGVRPDHVPMLNYLAIVQSQLGHHDDAIATAREAVRIDPSADNYIQLADRLAGRDRGASLAAFREAVRLRPDDLDMRFRYLDDIWNGHDDLDSALEILADIARHGPAAEKRATPYVVRVLVQKGDFDRARAVALEWGLRHRGDLTVAAELADGLLGKQAWQAAEAEYRELIRLAPPAAAAQFHAGLGRALQGKGDPQGAIAAFNKAAEVDPARPEYDREVATTFLSAGEEDAAITHAREALERFPGDRQLLKFLGWTLCKVKKDYAAGLPHLREVVRLCSAEVVPGVSIPNPDCSRAQNDLGRCLLDSGAVVEAVACLREAVRLWERNAAAHHNLGLALRVRREWGEAVASLQKAAEIEPGDSAYHYEVAAALNAKGDVDAAVACARDALKRFPADARLHGFLGWTLCKAKKDFAAGLPHLREVVHLNSRDALAHNNLGRCLYDRGAVEEAVASLREAIRLDAKLSAAHHNMGLACLAKRDWPGAVAALRALTGLEPRNVWAHDNLGFALRNAGKSEEAIACFRTALRIDPNYAFARGNLGWSLYQKGELDESLRECEAAARLDPDAGWIRDNLAVVRKAKEERDARVAPPRSTGP